MTGALPFGYHNVAVGYNIASGDGAYFGGKNRKELQDENQTLSIENQKLHEKIKQLEKNNEIITDSLSNMV